jgi:cellobiose-specific phosphotransferase system component IIA
MSIKELKKQEARRVRKEAEKCLRHASIVLSKPAHEIEGYIVQLMTARIPLKSQTILNHAINHLATQLIPNLGFAELARAQALLATRDDAPLASDDVDK